MKKSLFSLFAVVGVLLLMLFSASAQAAQDSGKKFHFGAKVGISLADVYGDDVDAVMAAISPLGVVKEMRVGFTGGLFMTYAPIDWIVIQPELLYTQKGSKLKGTWPVIGTGEATLKLDYIEIPVLVKLRLPLGGFKPNIFAGPSFSFNVTARTSGQLAGATGSSSLKGTPYEPETFDFGMVLGGGVDLE